MNVRQSVEVALREEDIQALKDGQSLQVPVDQDTRIILFKDEQTQEGDR
jgi:hypothetical protein